MAVLPYSPLASSTSDTAASGLTLASRLADWYRGLDDTSGLKQAILSDTARKLTKRGAEAAQVVLDDKQIKGYADHSVKVAHDVADSVTVWYSELEPGYVARFGQWLGGLWERILMAFSGWGGWWGNITGWSGWEQISAIVGGVGPAFESFLVWCTTPRGCSPSDASGRGLDGGLIVVFGVRRGH